MKNNSYAQVLIAIICLAMLHMTGIFAQEVEKIESYSNNENAGLIIACSERIEFVDEATQSPPSLKLIFPGAMLPEKNHDKFVELAPLFRYDAKEKSSGPMGMYTEIILYFRSLPAYEIKYDDKNKLHVFWKVQAADYPEPLSDYTIENVKNFGNKVSLNFKGADILDVLRLLAEQNNLNVVAGEVVSGEVTVKLKNVDVGTALDAILKVNGYDWFIQENILVIKPTEDEMSGELVTKVYKLEYTDATAVGVALTHVLSEKGEFQIFSPVGVGGGFMGGMGGMGMMGGMGGMGGMGARGSGNLVSGSRGITGGGAGQQLSPGFSGGFGGGLGSTQPSSQAGSMGGMAQGRFGGTTADYLIVTDLYTNFKIIDKVVTDLDIKVPQINISVKFIETALTTEERLGINWDLRAQLTGPHEEGTSPDLTNNQTGGIDLGSIGDLKIASLSLPAFTNLLEILASDNETKLIQEPSVTTLNNTMATVEVGTTYPVQITQITEIASITSFQDEEIHITLNVQPRLSSDEYITMVIEAVVQALVGFSGVNNDQPIISERKTRAQNMVKSGETLLIGGLIFEQLIETETKVPIASSIPLLGRLFKHRITETEQRELLIFITPTKVVL